MLVPSSLTEFVLKTKFATAEDIAAVRDLFATTGPNITISNDEIVERTGLDLRVARAAIAALVQNGVPIISTRDGGYVLSTDRPFLTRELERLRSQAKQIALRADGIATFLLRTGLDADTMLAESYCTPH